MAVGGVVVLARSCSFEAFQTEFLQKSLFAVGVPRNEAETVARRGFPCGILTDEGATRCSAWQKQPTSPASNPGERLRSVVKVP